MDLFENISSAQRVFLEFDEFPKVADDDEVINDQSMVFDDVSFYSLLFIDVTISSPL